MQLDKLQEYFNRIYDRVVDGKYKLKGKKGIDRPEIDEKHLYLEVINYFIYKWSLTIVNSCTSTINYITS